MAISIKTVCAYLALTLTGYISSSEVSAASGPNSMTVTWVGKVTAGSRKTFTCSASCIPLCTYRWSLKGRSVNGSVLTFIPDGQDSSIELQCLALNPESGKTTMAATIIQIINPVSVRPSPPLTLPALGRSVSLACQGSHRGLPVAWFKDGQKVSPDGRINLEVHNTTLHFDSLLPSDGGFYQCEAALDDSDVMSQGYLLNFDPWLVNISGPDRVDSGSQRTFTCLTTCTVDVDCTISWNLNGVFSNSLYLSVNRNVLTWTPSKPGTFQNFTCMAKNDAAGRFAEATKRVEVVGGSIAGSSDKVVLSKLFGLALGVGLLFLFET